MNLALSLHYSTERAAEAVALVEEDVAFTYRELRERISRLAAGLSELGVTPGDSVATVLKNRRQTVEAVVRDTR